jgi:hypothetical protein
MLTTTEIDRIAQVGNVLRPDWPSRSLVSFLTTNHASRAYRDVLLALVAIAADPATQTPARMNGAGPWWLASQNVFAAGEQAEHRYPRCPEPGHGSYPESNCGACRAEALELEARGVEDRTPEQQEISRAGAAAVKAALANAKRGTA